MTRGQALTIAVLFGFVLLICMGFFAVLYLPYETLLQAVEPSATPTSTVTPTVTPSPTFPNFLPTASQETPVPAEPTATNTMVPTITPTPSQPSTPTVEFKIPTPVFRPTATEVIVPEDTATPVGPTATLVPARQYRVTFEADETTVVIGECTDLTWSVEGPVTVWFEGEPAERSGEEEVCPRRDTTYVLTTQTSGSQEVRRHEIKIFVKERDEE